MLGFEAHKAAPVLTEAWKASPATVRLISAHQGSYSMGEHPAHFPEQSWSRSVRVGLVLSSGSRCILS